MFLLIPAKIRTRGRFLGNFKPKDMKSHRKITQKIGGTDLEKLWKREKIVRETQENVKRQVKNASNALKLHIYNKNTSHNTP